MTRWLGHDAQARLVAEMRQLQFDELVFVLPTPVRRDAFERASLDLLPPTALARAIDVGTRVDSRHPYLAAYSGILDLS